MIKIYFIIIISNLILNVFLDKRIKNIVTLTEESKRKIKNNKKNEIYLSDMKVKILIFIPVLNIITFLILIYLITMDYNTFEKSIEKYIKDMEE